jgi:hypothetical protein
MALILEGLCHQILTGWNSICLGFKHHRWAHTYFFCPQPQLRNLRESLQQLHITISAIALFSTVRNFKPAIFFKVWLRNCISTHLQWIAKVRTKKVVELCFHFAKGRTPADILTTTVMRTAPLDLKVAQYDEVQNFKVRNNKILWNKVYT